MLFGPRLAPLLVSRGPEWDGGNVGATVSGNSPLLPLSWLTPAFVCVSDPQRGSRGAPGHPGACSPRCDVQQRAPRGRRAVSQACRPVPLTETRAWGGPDRPLPARPCESHIVLRARQRARGFSPVNVASVAHPASRVKSSPFR